MTTRSLDCRLLMPYSELWYLSENMLIPYTRQRPAQYLNAMKIRRIRCCLATLTGFSSALPARLGATELCQTGQTAGFCRIWARPSRLRRRTSDALIDLRVDAATVGSPTVATTATCL